MSERSEAAAERVKLLREEIQALDARLKAAQREQEWLWRVRREKLKELRDGEGEGASDA